MINKKVVKHLLETVDAGLSWGLGSAAIPGQMCVEAAVCYALGQKHGDKPTCVAPIVRDFKIRLNDSSWSSPKARAAGMRKVAVAQLGSAKKIYSHEFNECFRKVLMLKAVPIALQKLKRMAIIGKYQYDGSKKFLKDLIRELNYSSYVDLRIINFFKALTEKHFSLDANRTTQRGMLVLVKDENKVLKMYADYALEVLIQLKSPGTKWLHLC